MYNLLKVAIHQPNFLPYMGFFHKLTLADAFVIMDNTQYDKKFTNRNKIIVPNNWTWITIPINKSDKFSLNKDVRINNDIEWKTSHWKKLTRSYNNSAFFKTFSSQLKNIYDKNWENLFDFNYELLKWTFEILGLKIEIIKESELNINGASSERLVNICKNIGAETYVSGVGGLNYITEELFVKNSISLEYQNFIHPIYKQNLSNNFIPNLSVIDILSNVGTKALSMLR